MVYSDIVTKVKEMSSSCDMTDDLQLSFLKYVFPFIELVDIELLNESSETIPARDVQATGYYCNIDDNCINVYLSCYNPSLNSNEQISEPDFSSLKSKLFNLIKIINDNSYREINESRPIYDLCDYIASNPSMDVILNIVTNYALSPACKDEGCTEIDKRRVSLRIYDIVDILDKINSNNSENLSLDLVGKFGEAAKAVLISQSADIDVYLTYFGGEWLAQLYKEDSVGLLSANVRSYLKRTNKVNREIIETVKDAPQEFVAYNNGISAIATAVVTKGENNFYAIEKLDNFLIVNGGQTTATLYECKTDRYDLKEIIVPVKLSVIKNSEASEYLVSNISLYSNSQTGIKKSDPPSNSRYYITYEEISKRVFATKNMVEYHCFFERTNGQYNTLKRMHSKKTDPFSSLNPEKYKFTKLQLAQAVLSWERRPDIVCKGQEKNFEYFHSIVKDLPIKIVDEDYFKNSYSLVLMYRKLDSIIKKKKLPYKSNLVTYTLAFFSYKCNKMFDLPSIWTIQELDFDLCNLFSKMVDNVYEAMIDSPKEYPDIRMWTRKPECWERVKKIDKEYSIILGETTYEFLPENTAKNYFDSNFKNSQLWLEMEKWHLQNKKIFTDKQIQMIHGMQSIIHKDSHNIKKITKKQEAFAKSIFLIAVENGFDYEKITSEVKNA